MGSGISHACFAGESKWNALNKPSKETKVKALTILKTSWGKILYFSRVGKVSSGGRDDPELQTVDRSGFWRQETLKM